MSIIFYGGTKEGVEKQLVCEHDWHGPCMDVVCRYFKCKLCGVTDRDVASEEEYWERVKDSMENALCQ